MRGWKKIFHVNENDKKAGAFTLISDKTDFKTEAITETKEGISTRKDIILVNIYVHNTGAPKYIKQILPDINREIDNNTIIV